MRAALFFCPDSWNLRLSLSLSISDLQVIIFEFVVGAPVLQTPKRSGALLLFPPYGAWSGVCLSGISCVPAPQTPECCGAYLVFPPYGAWSGRRLP